MLKNDDAISSHSFAFILLVTSYRWFLKAKKFSAHEIQLVPLQDYELSSRYILSQPYVLAFH